MTIQTQPRETSVFVQMSHSGRFDDPIVALITDATRRRGSAVFQAALARLGPFAAKLLLHLSLPNVPQEVKLAQLPRIARTPSNLRYDRAISSVIAFAVLSRFDEYIQSELEARGYRRSYVNGTGMDLLQALHGVWKSRSDDRLIALSANEAACFLGFVADVEGLKIAIRERLEDFKTLAKEVHLAASHLS
jgi:hypothetical protein